MSLVGALKNPVLPSAQRGHRHGLLPNRSTLNRIQEAASRSCLLIVGQAGQSIIVA